MRRYEGDGQLARLARTGAVDYVLTVDSDLFIHRCPNVEAMMGGALEFVHRGGAMQVDKGYDKLRTFAARHGIDVVIPVKKRKKAAGAEEKSRKRFARESVRGDRKTARTRIHSEREMIRVKNYKLLTQMLPMEYKDILDDMIWVCVCLGNLDVGLTSKEYEETVATKRRKTEQAERETPPQGSAP